MEVVVSEHDSEQSRSCANESINHEAEADATEAVRLPSLPKRVIAPL